MECSLSEVAASLKLGISEMLKRIKEPIKSAIKRDNQTFHIFLDSVLTKTSLSSSRDVQIIQTVNAIGRLNQIQSSHTTPPKANISSLSSSEVRLTGF